MNVGRKLLEKLKDWEEYYYEYNKTHQDLKEIIDLFEKWIEFHEEMFDHSKFKKGVSKKRIKEWEEYYENNSNR